MHNNPKSIANILNDYFTSAGTKLANAIGDRCNPLVCLSWDTTSTSDFSFSYIKESFVHKYVSGLKIKKAIGLDMISARLLKDSADTIAPCLTFLFNKSLFSAVFPSIWEKGKVVPIFKSGDRTSASNYRPVTIISNIQ